jgi:hypothetical protein
LNADLKKAAIERMRSGLMLDAAKDDATAIEEVWRKCEQISDQVSQADFDKKTAVFLRALFCDAKKRVCAEHLICDPRRSANAIATGIIRSWISDEEDRRDFSGQVARALLSEDGQPCATSKELDEEIREPLREVIERTARSPAHTSPP